jgi:hypothetical protein
MNKIIRTIFDTWTEESAYLLGFWMADGSIRLRNFKRTEKIFCIYNTDFEIMSRFCALLGTNMSSSRKKKSTKPLYEIYAHSDKMFDFCYAITRSTSKSDKEVQIPEIPDHLFHHFIRGFFDGDGSICIKRYKTRHGKLVEALQTSFTAGKDTESFLEKLRDRIREFIPVGLKKIDHGKTGKKLIFNQYDSMLLCEWMYQDASWYIEHKKMTWGSTDKEKLRNSVKFFSNKV